MDSQSTEHWEIEQDEFGRPLVRHRHPTKTVSAYVAKDVDGVWARCPECAERLQMPEGGQLPR
jgi:hypothetical protein